MNNKQRADIKKIADIIKVAIKDLEYILNKEEEKYDNLSESLQQSARGETIEEAIDVLTDNIENLQEIVDELLTI